MSGVPIEPAEAWRRVAPYARPLPVETLPRRRALGRVLAAPLTATVDVPASDVSAMDGYAVTAAVGPGDELPVAGTVAAGDPPGFVLAAGSAARIMTGAATPAGADRVVPVELTDGGETRVRFTSGVDAGANIRRQAEVLAAGQEILLGGAVLTPAALALLATHGHGKVRVHAAPRVAILVTGDEVVPPEDFPAPGRLRDSHTDFLLAAGRTLGLEPEPLGIVADDRAALAAAVRRGIGSDVLLVTGGVSKGEFDFVEEVLAGLGCEVLFDAVAIQPGKPFVAARHDGGLVFGLPGNPASVMVAFWLFVRPALRRMLGLADGYWQGAERGVLAAELPPAKARDRFFAAEVRREGGRALVRPRPPMGSHDVVAYGQGGALVRSPAGSSGGRPGDACEFLALTP